jgi:hypothetical protein
MKGGVLNSGVLATDVAPESVPVIGWRGTDVAGRAVHVALSNLGRVDPDRCGALVSDRMDDCNHLDEN